MKQFFFIVTELNNEIYCRIYTTETKVLYVKKKFETYEIAHAFGLAYCDDEISYIGNGGPFIKAFPGDHLT